ncbi:hypothetical protein PUN28_001412 [Cardiocondyla obscurior]|uniref:Uncharacterized protein n=1 Tax=Cardiocondyla obscurior TaxID=286306 RepID=A0AAW2H5I6_9HYME
MFFSLRRLTRKIRSRIVCRGGSQNYRKILAFLPRVLSGSITYAVYVTRLATCARADSYCRSARLTA